MYTLFVPSYRNVYWKEKVAWIQEKRNHNKPK